MNWILNILAWVVGKLFGKAPGQSVADTENQQLGAATVTANAAVQVGKTETAVAQAEADAPKTQAATVAALDKGQF